MSGEIKTPVDWMQAAPVFEADGERGLVMTSPLVSTPLAKLPSYDSGPGRFKGAHYIKCISPAWCVEPGA